MSIGGFCLVLHGHLPWVLHHGRWPHGEDWLYEAACETWLPLIDVLVTCRSEGVVPRWTVGLTPILLEQLGHDRFRDGLLDYVAANAARARDDREAFDREGKPHLAYLAQRHEERFEALGARFASWGRDIAGVLRGFGEHGGIELLSSNATHAYHPLVLHDACARAQIRAGLATTRRHLGSSAAGVWLPECAYRPPGPWVPPVLHGDERQRAGVAGLFADEGVRFFVVDTHLITGSRSEAVLDGERVEPVGSDQADWDGARAWRDVLEPHRVVEAGALTPVTVLGRCPDVSEQVWSGDVGYPGDPRYLEFHKRHGQRGLRYWKVTGPDVDLGDKDPYHPDDVGTALHEQAKHFVDAVKARLWSHHRATGRYGVVCAPFDAELFGHWWAEGPAFLLEVARRIHHDPDIDALTMSEALERCPADKAVSLPEGTWGAGGDHRVWLNDDLRFYWNAAYRAEDRFLDLWHRVPWQRGPSPGAELLLEAGRQLLLLQASDWPFVVSTGGAVDYGLRRIFEHTRRFDDLCLGVEDWLGQPDAHMDPVVRSTLERCRLLDPVFPDLDLGWWS